MGDRLTSQDFEERFDLPGWRVIDDGVETWWRARSFTEAGTLVAEIAALADVVNHHPDLTLSYPGRVHVRLTSHDAGGLTDRDGDLAQQISEAASSRGATADWDQS